MPDLLLDRKRQLIAENARLRQEISTEFNAIEASLDWVNVGARIGGNVRKNGGLVLSTLGGLFLAWRLVKRFRSGHAASEDEAEESPSLVSRLLKGGMKAAALIGPVLKMMR